MNKILFIISVLAMLAAIFIMAGCPVTEEEDEKELPQMNCNLAMNYVYETCDIAYNDTSGDTSEELTLGEAIGKCEEWENTEDWEDSFWECIVNCADINRTPKKCDSFKACENEC